MSGTKLPTSAGLYGGHRSSHHPQDRCCNRCGRCRSRRYRPPNLAAKLTWARPELRLDEPRRCERRSGCGRTCRPSGAPWPPEHKKAFDLTAEALSAQPLTLRRLPQPRRSGRRQVANTLSPQGSSQPIHAVLRCCLTPASVATPAKAPPNCQATRVFDQRDRLLAAITVG